MKNTITLIKLGAIMALAGALGTGCSSTSAPQRSGFLRQYNQLEKVDDSTWRYINYDRLANCSKFNLFEVKVLFDEYKGQPDPSGANSRAGTGAS